MSSFVSAWPFSFIAAPFTPFDESGGVTLERVAAQAQYLRRTGVAGAFVCGTTGEGLSLTMTERRAVAERWREAAEGLKLFVHVGHSSVAEARTLAAHAAAIGVDAIAAMGPIFYAATDPETLVAYCQEIAAAAPALPFYYYHLPSMTHVSPHAHLSLEAMLRTIPTFAGVKFTHEDLEDYRKCLAIADGRCEILFGRDELLLEGLRAGATSAVGSTYNFAAPLSAKIASCFRTGQIREAECHQAISTAGIGVMIRCGGLPAIKETMRLFGVNCGSVRRPLRALAPGREIELKSGLIEAGYIDREML